MLCNTHAALATAFLSLAGAKDALSAPGNLDPSYGANGPGYTLVDVGLRESMGDMVALPDGSVVGSVVHGPYTMLNYENVGLIKLDAAGNRDLAFGRAGYARHKVTPKPHLGHSALATADGNFWQVTQGWTAFYVSAYLENGAAMAGFGVDGLATIEFPLGTAGRGIKRFAVAVQPLARRLIIAGSIFTRTGDFDLVLIGLDLQNGMLDPSFGNGGLVQTNIVSGGDEGWSSLSIASDDSIIVAGTTLPPGGSFMGDVVVGRFQADGKTDAAFGSSGIARVDFGLDDEGSSVAVTSPGRILTAATVCNPPVPMTSRSCVIGLVALSPDGILDVTFGTGGMTTYSAPGASATVSDMAIGLDGAAYVSGDLLRPRPSGPEVGTFVLASNAQGDALAPFGSSGPGLSTWMLPLPGGGIGLGNVIELVPGERLIIGGYDQLRDVSTFVAIEK